MATASATRRATTVSATRAAKAEVSAPSRREFLFYLWGASMALLLGEATAGFIWFIFLRFRAGEFGGIFQLDSAKVPAAGTAPFTVPEGRFHVSHTEDDALVVLYQVCTHLGCIPKWVDTNHRFECPCHGSKYELDGKYIEGPAPRSLDRFHTTITFADGTTATSNEMGDPIPLERRVIGCHSVHQGLLIRCLLSTAPSQEPDAHRLPQSGTAHHVDASGA